MYNKNSDEGYMLVDDVEYAKHLHDSHSDLPFLAERIKISREGSVKKFYAICIIKKYIVYIRTLKQALNHRLTLKKSTEY